MKISIVTGPLLPVPALQGGSTSRIWQGLAEQFAAKDHQVTIVCRSYIGQPQSETIKGVKYFRHGGFAQSQTTTLDLLKDLSYAISVMPVLPRADILAINDFWLPVFAPLLSRRAGLTVSIAGRFPKGQYRLYPGAARFVALSSAIKDAIANQHPAAIPRIRVIPNPVDTDVFSLSTTSCSSNNKTILYVGRIHPEKGIHLLVDAFAMLTKQLPQVRLKIVGPVKASQGGGGEDYFNTLKAKVQGLPIEFSEPIFDLHQLAEVYSSADLFCYPSLAEKGESCPVAPLEAMASGIVPIVSDLACFKNFIEAGTTGYFFDHRSTDAANNLAVAIAKAINQPEQTYQMSIIARKKALEFSYEQVANLYLADFEELLGNKNISN